MIPRSLAALPAVALLAAVASAEPFTGRYLVEAPADPRTGAQFTGYVEFIGGTTTPGTTYLDEEGFYFRLADTSAFSLVVTWSGRTPVVYNDLSDALLDNPIVFNARLGAAELIPLGGIAPFTTGDTSGRWVARGDLDGENDGIDFVQVDERPVPSAWVGIQDLGSPDFIGAFYAIGPPHSAWKLVLDTSAVPEPAGLALAAPLLAVAWSRRRRRRRSRGVQSTP